MRPPLSITPHLPRDLVIDRLLQKPKRIQVLHFGARAEFFRAFQPHRNIGIAAQMAFFHVAGRDFDELQSLFDFA